MSSEYLTMEAAPGYTGVTRKTALRSNENRLRRAGFTAPRGTMQNHRRARNIGAVSAPSVRMGDRARAAAVKAAPRKWATVDTMAPADLAAARAAMNARRVAKGLAPLA